MSRPYLSIVVPAFNEKDNVFVLYEKIALECKRIGLDFEILFVDDGSDDETPYVLRGLRERDQRIRIIRLSRNHGHQLALSAGLDYCRGDYALTMDADLQHPPEMIPRFLEEAKKGFDIVSGVKERTVDRGRVKNFLATVYYTLFRKLTSIHVEPNASDFRLYSEKALRVIRGMRERERYLRGMVEWTGLSQARISFVSPARHTGTPKYTFRKLAKLASYGVFSFSAFPLRLSMWIGMVVVGLEAVYIACELFVGPGGHFPFSMQAGMNMLILLMLGLLFFCIGLLGEYVLRIYEEVKQRPLYVIDWTEGIERIEWEAPPQPRRPLGD